MPFTMMLKTLENIESITKPKKNGIEVADNGIDKVNNKSSNCSSDFDKKFAF